MYIKDGDVVKEVPLSLPADGQKVWIDTGPSDQPTLAEALHVLGWDPALATHMTEEIHRAQLQYMGNLMTLSVFVADQEDMLPLSLIVGPGILVTIHDKSLAVLDDLKQTLAKQPDLLNSAHYLLYAILDRLTDTFLEQVDASEELFDNLEEDILRGTDRSHQVFQLRRTLHQNRGVLADMRRIAARLSRRQFSSSDPRVTDSNIFIDVYDGLYHVMDNIDSLRDSLTGLVDLQLNQRSTRLNEIMKFLTVFSTIFLPLTFITGFFGMNLHPMRELTAPYAQELTIVLMILVAGVMLWLFKKRKWLG